MLTDKPINLNHKEFLIRKISVREMLSEDTIQAVVDHQFKSALAGLNNNNQVEFSGFGKFMFNVKQATRDLTSVNETVGKLNLELANAEPQSKEWSRTNTKLRNALEMQEYLQSKLYR